MLKCLIWSSYVALYGHIACILLCYELTSKPVFLDGPIYQIVLKIISMIQKILLVSVDLFIWNEYDYLI